MKHGDTVLVFSEDGLAWAKYHEGDGKSHTVEIYGEFRLIDEDYLGIPIPLTQGLYAAVSPQDYPKVSGHKWRAHNRMGKIYAERGNWGSNGEGLIQMHRVIYGNEKTCVFGDGNTLNMVRYNVRLVPLGLIISDSKAKNNPNCGIKPYAPSGHYRVCVGSLRDRGYAGTFATEEDARIARGIKRAERYGLPKPDLEMPKGITRAQAARSNGRSRNRYGYRGVTINPNNSDNWIAQIGYTLVGGRRITEYLGSYADIIDAAIAYNKRAKELWGDEAPQNVIEENVG